MARLKDDLEWFLRLPVQARAIGGAVVVAVAVFAIANDALPALLVLGAIVIASRYRKEDVKKVRAELQRLHGPPATETGLAERQAEERARRAQVREAHGGVLPISEFTPPEAPPATRAEPPEPDIAAELAEAERERRRALFRQVAERPAVSTAAPRPTQAPNAGGSIVEDGGGFWRRKPKSRGSIVE